MKLSSPLLLSLVLGGSTVAVSADRIRAVPHKTHRAGAAIATRRAARHLKEEETAAAADKEEDTGAGQCGQCKKADDCRSGYDCVGATESGCFNFDASADKNLYCVPGPTDAPTVAGTDAPTVAVTGAPTTDGTIAPTDVIEEEESSVAAGDATAAPSAAVTTAPPTVIIPVATPAPSEAATTVTPTAAPSEAATTLEPTASPSDASTTLEPTVSPSEAASTTAAPTVAATSTAGPTVAVAGSSTYGILRYFGGNPEHTLFACEGDCDYDYDCEGELVCLQRNDGEPIPGCGGEAEAEDTDYCIKPMSGRGSVVAAAQAAPSSAAGSRRVGMIATVGVAVVGAASAVILGMF